MKDALIFVAGHRGLVGSAIVRELKHSGYTNIITRNREELDLTNTQDVLDFFDINNPEIVIDCAAKVGGIKANNDYPVEFLLDNLKIQNNLIEAAHITNVEKFLFLGSSCIYPKYSSQPISEDSFLTGALEPTNEPYAIAKIAGIKLCQSYNKQYGKNFISVMPTNVYGIGDNFNLETAHVLPSILRKMHIAKIYNIPMVVIWGSGIPKREFIFSEDLASACVFLMENYNSSDIINIGCGEDISIYDLAILIKNIVGYNGKLAFDDSNPDGTPRKVLNVSKLNNLGWKAQTNLKDGIIKTYEWYKKNYKEIL